MQCADFVLLGDGRTDQSTLRRRHTIVGMPDDVSVQICTAQQTQTAATAAPSPQNTDLRAPDQTANNQQQACNVVKAIVDGMRSHNEFPKTHRIRGVLVVGMEQRSSDAKVSEHVLHATLHNT